jgi:uncharacterized protein YbbC (DUF1343 family)
MPVPKISSITGLLITLRKQRPKPEQLAGIDVFCFDLQDVGYWFYTLTFRIWLYYGGVKSRQKTISVDKLTDSILNGV